MLSRISRSGYTMVELLIVLTVLGIALMLAIPSFSVLEYGWKHRVCQENRERLLMSAAAEGWTLEADLPISADPEYLTDCPYGGSWSLQREDSSNWYISCSECDADEEP